MTNSDKQMIDGLVRRLARAYLNGLKLELDGEAVSLLVRVFEIELDYLDIGTSTARKVQLG